MRHDYWPEAAALIAMSMAAIFIFSPWPWASRLPWDVAAAFGTVVAAAGTVAAVVIALRVSRRDTAWRRDQEKREALVVWQIVRIDVEQCLVMVEAVREVLMEIKKPPVQQGLHIQNVERLERCFQYAKLESAWRLVEKLPWMAPWRADNVATIMGLTPLLRKRVASFMSGANDLNFSEFIEDHTCLIAQCDQVIDGCSAALADRPPRVSLPPSGRL